MEGVKVSCPPLFVLLNPKNIELLSLFLEIRELKGSHTSDLIKQTVEELLNEYDLTLQDAFHIVTDDASSMIAAFRVSNDLEGEDDQQDQEDENSCEECDTNEEEAEKEAEDFDEIIR